MNIMTLIWKPALGVLAYYRGQETIEPHLCRLIRTATTRWSSISRTAMGLRRGDSATIHLDNRAMCCGL